MSISYSVRHNDDGDLVSRDGIEGDISDYIDEIDQEPRGRRPENRTMLVRVCRNPLASNNTQSVNTSSQNVTTDNECQLKKVIVSSAEGQNPDMVSEGGIPQDVLEELERDGDWTVSQNETEAEGRGSRFKRNAEGNWTDVDIGSGSSEDGATGIEIGEEVQNTTDALVKVKAEEKSETPSMSNGTKEDLEESNDIFLKSNPQLNENISPLELSLSEEMHQNLIPQNHVKAERERLTSDLLDPDYNYTADHNMINLSLEYDDYSQEVANFPVYSTFIKYILFHKCHKCKTLSPSSTINATFFILGEWHFRFICHR